MKKKILGIVLIGIIIIVAAVGFGTEENSKKGESSKSNQINHIPVRVQKVNRGDISIEYTYASKLKPENEIGVIAKASGEVKNVYFDIGDKVKKGDILFRLDNESVENKLEELEKQLDAVNLTIKLQENSVDSSKGSQYIQQKSQLEMNLKNAETSLNDAKTNYDDMKKLYESGAIAKSQLTQAQSSYNMAKNSYETAKTNYDLYIKDLSVKSIQASEAQLEQSKLQKDQLLLNIKSTKDALADTEVKSPIDGYVSSRSVKVGEMVSNSMPAFTIVQTNNLLVEVGVSENLITKIKKGDRVNIYVDAISTKPFVGTITNISPAIDNKTSKYLTKIEINNSENKLLAGMFAEVAFVQQSKENVIKVPVDSVLKDDNGQYVFVVENNTAKQEYVKTGIETGTEYEIIEGIKENQQIMVSGQNFVQDKDLVDIVE